MNIPFSECECACHECRSMCTVIPCIPSPEEGRIMMAEGLGESLMLRLDEQDGQIIESLCPAVRGREGRDVGCSLPLGDCTFFDGKYCDIHDSGFKPLEGRLARHGRGEHSSNGVHEYVLALWDTDDGRNLVNKWRQQCEKGD